MQISVTVDDRRWFFDRAAVVKAVKTSTRRVLAKAGAHVRKHAMHSIKRTRVKDLTPNQRQAYNIRKSEARKAGLPKPMVPVIHSRPGEPPRSITGKLKRGLRFVYEAKTQSVKIGVESFARTSHRMDPPGALEFGGTTFRATRGRGRTGSRHRRIAARPYLRPARAKVARTMSQLWAAEAPNFGKNTTRRAVRLG